MAVVVDTEVKNKIYKYKIPDYIKQRFWKDHAPHLTKKEVDLIFKSFKDYIYLTQISNSYLSSFIVDEAWHTFILFTKDYERFCLSTVGKFIHHSPSISIGGYKSDISDIEDTYKRMKKYLPDSKLYKMDKRMKIKGSKSKGIISLKKKKKKMIVFLDNKKIGKFNG